MGDGTFVVRKTELPDLFLQQSHSIEVPDPVPQKFRIASPAVTSEETVAGDAAEPTLAAGELAATEQQVTKFTKRTRKTKRDVTSLPQTLTQTATSNDGQKITITETLQLGDTSAAPSALLSIESEAMGDGTFVVRKTELPDLFSQQSHSIEVPDFIPVKFQATVPTITTEENSEGIAATPALEDGDLAATEQQMTKHVVRKQRKTRVIPDNVSLEGAEFVDTVAYTTTEELVDLGAAPDTGASVVASSVTPIGGGKALRTTKSVAAPIPDARVIENRLTPLASDVLFIETRVMPAAPPAYGTAHPSSSWPNHKLVLIKPNGRDGVLYDFYYVADRPNQDDYNFEYSEGGMVLTRTYIEPRNNLASFGAVSPGAADTRFSDYKFATRSVQRIDEKELDSLYLIVKLVFSHQGVPIALSTARKSGYTVTRSTELGTDAEDSANSSAKFDERGWVNETETVDVTGGTIVSEQESKPFVTLVNNTTVSSTSSLPAAGTGSSRLVYDNGETQVYENTEVTSTAREGTAGTEKDEKPYVSIQTNKKYAATGDVLTKTGSSQVVYNDGVSQVYEVNEVTATVKASTAGEEKDEKPYVSIKTTKKYDSSSAVSTKTGSSKLIYDDGTAKVYEVDEVSSTAKLGTAGEEKDEKPYVSIKTTKKYDSSSAVSTKTGSSKLIYDDGTAKVYEVDEVAATIKEGPAGTEKDEKPYVTLTTAKKYSGSGDVGTATGSSQLVYNDGDQQVYEVNEVTATVKTGLKAVETTAQQWGSLQSTTNYTTSDNAPPGGSVQLVYDGGGVKVYEASTPSVTVQGSNTDIDANAWGKITWAGTYATTSSGEKSRQVWSNGKDSVFLNENATLAVSGSSKDIDPQQWGSITWDGSYSTATGGTKSRQIYSGPGGAVFLNETPTVAIAGGTIDVDSKEWGQITWTGTYSNTQTTADGGRSRQVWRMGSDVVFLNEVPTLTISDQSFTSAKEDNLLLTETQTSSYASSSVSTGSNSRSRLIFSLGNYRVYENIDITRVAKPSRTYMSAIPIDVPPSLVNLIAHTFTLRDQSSSYRWEPIMTAGYVGPYPATVTEYWTDASTSTPTPVCFRPTPMSFQTPLGGISVAACLHGSWNFMITTGTEHPDYLFQTWSAFYQATTPPTSAGTHLMNVDTQSYMGGYIVREYRVTLTI